MSAQLTSAGESLSAIGGSLLASLGKGVSRVKELSKGFASDVAGISGGSSDLPVPDKPETARARSEA